MELILETKEIEQAIKYYVKNKLQIQQDIVDIEGIDYVTIPDIRIYLKEVKNKWK